MPFLIGLVGKPNAGKSTMLKALTLADVKIANYPFTTIYPNIATGYIITDCPCKSLGLKCNPNNSQCISGKRMIPVQLMDVAGLVPGAHEGRGLGNKFLDDLRQARVLIHVLDCSGLTDEEGRETRGHNPSKDVEFLEIEIEEWFFSVLKKGLVKYERLSKLEKTDIVKILSEQVTGLGINEIQVKYVMDASPIKDFSDESVRNLAKALRKESKPMIIAANKMDSPNAKENIDIIRKEHPEYIAVPCSAESEAALRMADKTGAVRYFPGSSDFEIINANEKQKAALESIRNLIKELGSTGVQEVLNKSVLDLLGMIVVYPVENENKFSNKKGAILPDAFLVPKGSTVIEMAAAVHTDLAKNFISAVDAKTKRRVGADHQLKDGDIIKIISGA